MLEEILSTSLPPQTPEQLIERARVITLMGIKDPNSLTTVFAEDLSRTIVDPSVIIDTIATSLELPPEAVKHFYLSAPEQLEEARRVLRQSSVGGLVVVQFPNLDNADSKTTVALIDFYANELYYPFTSRRRQLNALHRKVVQIYDASLPLALARSGTYDALHKMQYVPRVDISDRIE